MYKLHFAAQEICVCVHRKPRREAAAEFNSDVHRKISAGQIQFHVHTRNKSCRLIFVAWFLVLLPEAQNKEDTQQGDRRINSAERLFVAEN